MKCLTYNESKDWLASIDVQIDGNRNLLLPMRPENVMTTMPKRAKALSFFSARLADWFPVDCNRLFWLSNWETYPPDQFIIFGKIRLGCGESRAPIEAPGHLFESSTEEENAIMAGLIFLITAFNWEAYIVAENRKDYIFLGDEYVVFSSANVERLKQASEVIADFKLEVIT
jgi:hypothetical protein